MMASMLREWHFRGQNFENLPGPLSPTLINKILNYDTVNVLGWIRAWIKMFSL